MHLSCATGAPNGCVRASAGPRFGLWDADRSRSVTRGQLMAVAKKKPAAPPAEPAKPKLASSVPELGKERELKAFREMLLIRRFEEKAGQMYGMGLIGGFCPLYIGQEAVVTGMMLAIREGRQASPARR